MSLRGRPTLHGAMERGGVRVLPPFEGDGPHAVLPRSLALAAGGGAPIRLQMID